MNPETAAILNALAEKLGTTTDYIWGILIKEAFFFNGINVVIAIILLSASIFLFKRSSDIYSVSRSCHTEYTKDICLFILVVMSFTSFVVIPCSIKNMLHPEYWALKEITQLLK